MDGSQDRTQVEWHECTVKWRHGDVPALAAWVTHADGRGVGVIVYTTPVDTLRTGARVGRQYARHFNYTVSGHMNGQAGTVEQAKIDAVACARCANPDTSTSTFKTKFMWMAKAVTLTNKDGAEQP